jgi:hypothetical protein
MNGEEHMRFTWAFELVGPKAINTLIAALQESAKEYNDKLTVTESELRDTFARLYGYSRSMIEHFNESVRFLRKTGIIFLEKQKESPEKVAVARAGATKFCVSKDVLSVNAWDIKDVFKYVARKAYDFHIPFKLLIDILNEGTSLIDKEVLREMLSEKMLRWAKENRPQYYEKKRMEMEERGKNIEKWKYPLAHFNEFLTIAEKAGLIIQKGRYIERVVGKKEKRISYNEFKDFLIKEYNEYIKEHPNVLMVPIDDLRSLITQKLEITKETFDVLMQSFILRNMGRIMVYRQRSKEEEVGIRLPNDVIIFAFTMRGEEAL